jgi:hypothetical protein
LVCKNQNVRNSTSLVSPKINLSKCTLLFKFPFIFFELMALSFMPQLVYFIFCINYVIPRIWHRA